MNSDYEIALKQLDIVRAEIRKIDRQIAALKDKRAILASNRTILSRRISEPRIGIRRNGGDIFVVKTDKLAEVLRPYLKERGARVAVAGRAGVAVRTLRAVMNDYRPTVTLWVADALLTAVGRQDALDDEVPIMHNPNYQRFNHFYEE